MRLHRRLLVHRVPIARVLAVAGFVFAFWLPALAQEAPPKGDGAPATEKGDDVELPGTPLDQGDRLVREEMWPAADDAGWAKPCLIPWQRTWDDAVAMSKQTGKPILICINMDGEIASEHYAGIRYRQPEVAKLYEDYVCVVASVYRHTPRDFDDEGRRVVCPRFGTVTCGEHIALEGVIYPKYCDGQRVAPRHIAVDLEGNEAYDVCYTNDTRSVFEAVYEGRKKLPAAKPNVVRGDRPILERVASRDAKDRQAVESAYVERQRER